MKARLQFVGRLALMIAACAGASATELRASGGDCEATSEAATRACFTAARADRSIQIGKCFNLSDPTARRTCRQQATTDLADAFSTCRETDDARDVACARLGPAAYDPVINPANFIAGVTNRYFPLVPGTTFVYEGQTPAGLEHSEFAVTHNTRVIQGVTCIEVHDTVLLDGELAEDTLDWFAQDVSGNVWYFGENTHEVEDGLITTIHGTFMAGVNGDKPGIVMKAAPAVGDFYRQEFSLGNAEDYADVVSLSASVTVPAGSYSNCLDTAETTPLEPDLLEHKFYALDVGQVKTVDAPTGSHVDLIQIVVGP